MIEIQKYIQKYGLDTLVKNHNLTMKETNGLILLKYNQAKSDLKKQVVKESRGIILEKDTYKVISMPFARFTNYSDSYADKIDWNTARVQNKLDGSVIQLYYYNGWNVGTSGTIEGDGVLKEGGQTMAQIFHSVVGEDFTDELNKDYIYVFELTTNQHTIVTKFDDDDVTLLTIRDKTKIDNGSYGELPREVVEMIANGLQLSVVEEYNFSNIEDIVKNFKELTFQDEGYVVVDDNFKRIKVKNPAWIAAHFNKDRSLNKNKLIDIIKSNEITEFVESYPNTEKSLKHMKVKYDEIKDFLLFIDKNRKQMTGKELATLIHKTLDEKNMSKSLVGMTFSYINSDFEDVYEFLSEIPNKKLIKFLK